MFALFAFFGCATCETVVQPPHTSVPCPDLYDPDIVPELSVVIDDAEWAALQDEYVNWEERRTRGLEIKPYHPLVSFRYDGEVVQDAVIRLKGNPCCSWSEGDKMQFVIAFNQVDRDGRFRGLRKIALDAPFYDPSLLRERVAMSYFADAGLPGSCANHATLTVNGELYGVYANIEFVDDELLDRQFPGEPRGALYKYNYLRGRFERKNEPGGIGPLEELYALEGDLDGLMAAFDYEQALYFWGAEAAINQSDGYWAGSINFYLYDHPERGWLFLPWDLDNAIDYWGARRNPMKRKDHHGHSGHLTTVLADDAERARFRAAVTDAHAALDADVLIDRVDRWDAQLRPLLERDPHRPFTMAEHDEAVESLRKHLSVRDHYLCQFLH